MRPLAIALLAATCVTGCATTAPSRLSASETSQAPRRCSPADPDRWAWFCVVGQILYGAASFFSAPNELTMR